MKKIISFVLLLAMMTTGGAVVFAADSANAAGQQVTKVVCPYNGERPLDGTGFQYGRNGGNVGTAVDCPNPDCPNDGERPLDGTGYQRGKGGR